MRARSTTARLAAIRHRQTGNKPFSEGVSYNARGEVIPDTGNNRHARRWAKAMLRKEGKL